MAWQCISPEVTVKGFKSESNDDMLWNGSEDDVNLRCECVEDEGNDYEDGDSTTGW